ncbi:hypothetical protein IQ241_02065 [Romeria aff. gracilis LEGE 07310]|uniref:Uncharacterized protein n=1 Tax=Vasconcelosia minhoensis LEGE 07310 TaxID=915328 RepID=A0A8J7AJZ9_9CYAN|nr:hypothetical protein [Romeria gracilis]MBE9076089.1 hypothetical protein [Romeria aff. gracilis LEGE 07310]
MPRRIFTALTEEQEALLPMYRDKWRAIQISTEPIDQDKVSEAIKAAYVISDFSGSSGVMVISEVNQKRKLTV